MRRSSVDIADMAARDNLAWALWRAARGHRDRAEVQRYLRSADHELAALRAALLDGSVSVGRFHRFVVHDPKRRVIHAPPFRERVLHHALMRHVGPVLDRTLVHDTYACRVGRGLHAAVARAQQLARRHPFCGQLDILGYFSSVCHERLLAALRRKFKRPALLALLERIVRSFEVTPGRGLPIGTLPSQHFANFYLGPADRFLEQNAYVRGAVRYMDDLTWWGATRPEVRAALHGLRRMLRVELGLEVHRERVAASRAGISLLGFRVSPRRLGLSRRRKQRFRRARRTWEAAYLRGEIDARELQRGADVALAIVAHAGAGKWIAAELARTPPPDA